MPTRFPSNPTTAFNGGGDSSFPKTVALYDDAPAGNHAVAMLRKMLNASPDETELRPRLWRFDFLDNPDRCSPAFVDAVEADIVIISASSSSDLSPSLASWIVLCLTGKRGTNAAIVALFGTPENMDGPASPRLRFVHNATREAGLDFFAPRMRRTNLSRAKIAIA